MNKKNKTLILLMVLGVIMILLGSTFAYFSWRSGENKEVVFNTSKGLQEYIIYDSGESKFVGDFQVGSGYTSGVHTTVSIYKSDKISDKMLYATINMKVKEIGENLNNSEALKWTVTLGNATSNGEVLASGNFTLLSSGSEMAILPNFEVTTTLTEYTIWIWLDETLADSSMTGEKLDVSIWTQVDQIVVDKFEITKLTNNYQIIKATAVNSGKKIIGYQVTDSNTEPSTWISIPENEQNNIYNLEYIVNNTGTYYIWFKDINNKIVNKNLDIDKIDLTGPVCTWDNISKNNLDEKETATISLLCTDSETGMIAKNLEVSDFTITNNIITISKVEKSTITNGYKYTLTVVGGNTSGETTITLPKDKLSDKVNNHNIETVSDNIIVETVKTYKINFNSNIFSAYTKTINGLTITYDYETSYLTINGTPTTNWFEFPDLTGLSFTEGDTYTYKSTYISGSFAKANDTDSTIGVNVKKSSGDNVSTRNYTVLRHITSGSTTNTLTINSSGASEGSGLRYYLWFATPADWTFTNYKIKVEFTKNDTTSVTYNSTYGTLPTSTRTGYTFDGWYTGENGTGTKITSTDKVSITSDQTLYAKWTVNAYTVNFDGNMYSTTTRTVNGLTISYDSTNSYLTINGTPTTTGYNLNHISGLTFTENEKYNLTLSYVSGTVTNSGTGGGSTGVDVETIALANVSTRNYTGSGYITSGSATKTLTINSAGASEGAGLRLWLWFATPADWTFNNYKIKINLTKDETANVTYGSTYGTLPTPKRVGFIFNGWYTGEKGTGTKVNSGDTVTITKDTTLYAKWTANIYTVSFNGNMFSTTSRTVNGLTITYDYDNSYLTINGTPTNTSTLLTNFTGLDFTSGDKYTMTLNYISGTYAYTGTGSASFVADVANAAGTGNLATRNYFSAAYPTSGSKTTTLTASDLAGTDGSGFRYWMWATTPASQTFTNYKMKVNITKSDTKKVTYNSAYGSLPIPKRAGFTFDGWYTGEKGTGTKITDTSIVSANYNQTFYAKWKDNILPYGTSSLSLTDGKFTLKLSNYGDAGSGLTGTYGFALTTNSNCSAATYTNQTGVSKDYSGSYTNGTTYYGCIKLTDNAGNIAYLSSSGVKYNFTSVNQQYTTAGEQKYTIPTTGTYKLEVWGAQGGSFSDTIYGGYGGYSKGLMYLEKDTILYINIGGTATATASGYNGGGSSNNTNKGGGGATHIATVSGLLSTLSSKTSNILIVAGGGGGSDNWSTGALGGNGGGIQGTSATITTDKTFKYATGGSQTTGGTNYTTGSYTATNGSFGQGGASKSAYGGGGGGGYYGGGAGGASSSWSAGGGGGSGYIGNSLLTDKYMYCYNCTTSTATATKTNTTTNVSSTPTANYAKSGAGAAKITATITTNVTSLVLTYNNSGGTGCYSKSIVNGGTYGTLCTPIRDGYSFSGWYTAATDGTQITSSTSVTVTANQTIYAHWTASTNPVITFSPNGNSSYVRGNVSSTILVSKGSDDLNSSTLRYIYSLSNNVSPSVEFSSGNSYSLTSATGKYYLIAQACDVNGKCTKKVSSPFYVDNTKPTGSVLLSQYKSSITANVNATDEGSGIKNYGYSITTASSCPTSGYTTSTNTQYTFNATASGTYRVCVKITDKAGNANTISNTITVTITEITYGTLISSYSCSNKTVGSSPYIISYTGKCEIVKEGTDNWKIKFLTSGTLKISANLNVDTFLVGGGAGGGGASYSDLTQYGSDSWWSHGDGGSGGYTKTYRNVNIKTSDTYTITVGSGGAASAAGSKSSLVGGSINHAANGGNTNRGAGGSGGGAGCTQYYDGGGGAGTGGKYGNAGGSCTGRTLSGGQSLSGGTGQGTTTCEFEQSSSGSNTDLTGCATGITAYGAGGTAAGSKAGTANTGNGGDGASSSGLYYAATSRAGYAGGSGIVIIRNSRANPEVTFTPNGNTKYVNSVSVSMDVNKGYNNLDTSTYKYTFSKSRTATPDKSFTRGTSYTFSGLSGIYYLVAKACDTTGACATQVSSAFYLDNTKPTASLSLTTSGFAVNATVSNVVDADSGLKNYGYLITTASSCPTSGYVTSTSSSYKFMVSSSGTYRVCVKLTDNTGNVNYINSTIKTSVSSSYYEKIANSYKCNNVSKGSSPYLITYAGNCQLVNDGNGNWRLKLLTSSSGGSGLTISESIYVDIFMVGGGGGGGNATWTDLTQYGSDTWWAHGSGGGGGYTKTIKKVTLGTSNYTITIGSGGAAGAVGGNTSFVGGNINQTANGGKASGGAGGSGGGAGCSQYYDGGGGAGTGGKYGNAGGSCTGRTLQDAQSLSGGAGQGTTTCEFAQSANGSNTDLTGCASGVTAYGAGGTAAGSKAGTANTGNGGDGASSSGLNYLATSKTGYAGGSGIIIIRNAR